MRKKKSEEQIKLGAVNDIRAARFLREVETSVQNLTKAFGWSQRRAKKCIDTYRAEQVILALQASTGLQQPPAMTKAGTDWTHPVSSYFEELQLNLIPSVVNSFLVVEATTTISEPFFDNLAAFASVRRASLIAGARSTLRNKLDSFPEIIRDNIIFDRIRVTDDLLIICDPGKSRSASDPLTHLLKANAGKTLASVIRV